ncbi:MAG: hypothetical protein PHE53_09595 [Thermoguttaceae bacterium]|nr:hypothetical protein [Thermoguttaceae bacterium]
MRRFMIGCEAMVALLSFIVTSFFFVQSTHAVEFNGVEYEMPDGVDLTQEFQLLEKLVVGNAQYNWQGETAPSDFVEMETLMNSESTKALWKSRWGIELPEYSESPSKDTAGSSEPVDTRLIRCAVSHWEVSNDGYKSNGGYGSDGGYESDDGYGVRNGPRKGQGDTFYLVALHQRIPDQKETFLRYVFIGKCVVRDARGALIYGTHPTGSIFYFSSKGEITRYYQLKDGKVAGTQICWEHRDIRMTTKIHEDGSFPNRLNQPFIEEGHSDLKEMRAVVFRREGIAAQLTISPTDFTVPGKWAIDAEEQCFDANDYWVPWYEAVDPPIAYPLPRQFRIAIP